MKKITILLSAAAMIMVSCTVELQEQEAHETMTSNNPVFFASFEMDAASKTFVDEQRHLLWTADDRISIFYNTYNQQYRFKGTTGDNSGAFAKVDTEEYVTGAELATNYAVYPYDPATKISFDGEISLTLPEIQNYANNSFGLGANTMVAITDGREDNYLSFKNLCGYLVIKLYGKEAIASITIKGNNGERIAGKSQVIATYGNEPVVSMNEDASDSIIIECGEGVTLGTTCETATEFWFCVPPTTFNNGFTIIAKGINGGLFVKETSSSHSIIRNVIQKMLPLECEMEYNYSLGDYVEGFGGGVVFNKTEKYIQLVSLTEAHDLPWNDAKLWCSNYGDGDWYLPTIDELKILQKNVGSVNSTLDAIPDAQPLYMGNKCYWSSTENGIYAWRMKMDGTVFSQGNDEKKTSNANYTRAIRTIDLNYPDSPMIPEAVDLGLPSGIKWASCNLGASKPEEYGGYYQWGGLEDVTDTDIYLDWSNCPFHTGSDVDAGWEKYIPSDVSSWWSGPGNPDNKALLDSGDDAAHVKLGGNWRMPTIAECQELIDNCTLEWTTLNGVDGQKFTSNKNGNSIFLPAAGYRDQGGLYFSGSGGIYWSLSLRTNFPNDACYMDFYSGNVSTNYIHHRYLGQSVRPVYADYITASSITLNETSLELTPDETAQLTASITPSNCPEQGLLWSSSDPSVATVSYNGLVTAISKGTATITVSWAGDNNIKATCHVSVSVPITPEAIDLGLPSGIKWASCNLGASKPEEYGGHYQWGGLEDVTDNSIYLDMSNCPYHTGSDWDNSWTKYIPSDKSSFWSGPGSPDNKTVLDPEDDVAHVKLGGSWRMPTIEEFDELCDNCTSVWTTLNGVEGRKFTSKKAGYTGRWIFLPAAGNHYGGSLNEVGNRGSYWSLSLYTDSPYCAYRMEFYSDHVSTYDDARDVGQSVRPVYGDIVKATGISLNKTSESLSIGSTFELTATLTPSNCAEKSVFWSSSNTSVATVSESGLVKAKSVGSAVITVSWAGDSNIKATCTVTVTCPVPEMVDLGLPSGLKWASFNLGASKPEECGDYYAWGATEPWYEGASRNPSSWKKSDGYIWENCPFCSDDEGEKFIKYSTRIKYWSGNGSPDKKIVLDPEDDAAHVQLGGEWRLFTIEEFQELRDNCDREWTNLNGVNGYKFTSRINGNSIFLPVTGYRWDTSLYDGYYKVKDPSDISSCCYWSANLDDDENDSALSADVSSPSNAKHYVSRCDGYAIRPVSE